MVHRRNVCTVFTYTWNRHGTSTTAESTAGASRSGEAAFGNSVDRHSSYKASVSRLKVNRHSSKLKVNRRSSFFFCVKIVSSF